VQSTHGGSTIAISKGTARGKGKAVKGPTKAPRKRPGAKAAPEGVKARKAVKKAKRQLVPRTRASETMTESQFFGFIRSALRDKFQRWKPKYDCLAAAKRPFRGENRRNQRWEYLCALTGKWFPLKEVEIDHIVPCGSLRTFADLPGFVERLFCEKEGLQVVSKAAHKLKTQAERTKK
jgi:hypothetical protein